MKYPPEMVVCKSQLISLPTVDNYLKCGTSYVSKRFCPQSVGYFVMVPTQATKGTVSYHNDKNNFEKFAIHIWELLTMVSELPNVTRKLFQ